MVNNDICGLAFLNCRRVFRQIVLSNIGHPRSRVSRIIGRDVQVFHVRAERGRGGHRSERVIPELVTFGQHHHPLSGADLATFEIPAK